MRLSTATEIKNIKEIGCHTVTGPKGLQLRVKQKSKTYFLRYTFSGKRKLIRLGSADFISLAQAREKGFELLELLEKGLDPQEEREATAQKNDSAEQKVSFRKCALNWVKERAQNNFWKNNVKGESNTLSRLTNHVLPRIGDMAIEDIQTEDIRNLLVPIWSRSPSTSSKVLADVRSIFRWAIALRIRQNRENPADLSGALGVLLEPYSKSRKQEENFAGLDFHEIPEFVKDISSVRGRTSEMLLFSIFLAARSKAVRNAKWSDIDIENKIWNIPPEDDKVKDKNRSRIIFLNDAAVNLLKKVVRFTDSPYVFCNAFGRAYSDMAMNQVIRKAHARKKLLDGIGWIDKEKSKRTGKEYIATQHATARSCFETWAKDDELGNNKKFDKEAIKLNMLHQRNDPYKGAYDRSKMERERRNMMEEWGKFCTNLLTSKHP